MQKASAPKDSWADIVDAVAAVVDIDVTARETKAFQRPRAVRCAADLLRLALMYGSGELSLRGVAAEAGVLNVAEISDVGVLNRLRNCGDWLARLLERLLAHQVKASTCDSAGGAMLRLALVDGSTVSGPGASGSEWRLHARYEPAAGRFTDLVLSDATQAEALSCVLVTPGDVVICDRGYARVRNFATVRKADSHFITRIGWRSIKMRDAGGVEFNPLDNLPKNGSDAIEHQVQVGSGEQTCKARLIIRRVPPEMVERQHARLKRKQSRKGEKTDPRTIIAAGFLMLLTSLPAEMASGERIAFLYRMRWQVELAFKRLKSIGGFDDLPATDPSLARTWLLSKLITTIMTEDLVTQVLDSPP